MLGAHSNSIWAITAYFNPAGYRRRLLNYRVFHQHLGVPLLTVELGFGGRYDLASGDATKLVQVPGGDVLWQKERLLNIAIASLPPQVTKVVWLDCDVLFEQEGWSQRAAALLDDYPMVQVFSELVRLPRQESPGFPIALSGIETRPSLCSLVSSATDLRTVCRSAPKLPGRLFPGPIGFGWAFRRSLFQQRGLYDVDILGGGDVSLLAALSGCYDIAIDAHRLNDRAQTHFLRWAEPVHEEVDQRVTCVPARIFHLWHGDLGDRGYETRYEALSRFLFDPEKDLVLDEHRVWRWASPKQEMHRYASEYFRRRREDG
ncbi:MAG: hypothetical protein ACKO6B_14060 [Planctomycetia bacterium]